MGTMRRLAGLDAAFLAAETPTTPLHVGALALAEAGAGWSFARLRAVVERNVASLAELSRRLVPVPLGLHHPLWADVGALDVSSHLRRLAAPAPGGEAELAEVVADVLARPLDRRLPLWELHAVEGLAGGGVAVVAKVHHALADGAGALRLLQALLADVPAPPPAPASARSSAPGPSSESCPPGGGGLLADEASLLADAVAAWPDGDAVAGAAAAAAQAAAAVRARNEGNGVGDTHVPPPAPFSAPVTSLNGPASPRRRVGWTRFALSDLREVARAFHVTPTEVFLATCAGGLRSYLTERGDLPDDDLVALVPRSSRTTVRAGAGVAGNRLSPLFVSLATTAPDAGDRLIGVASSLREAAEQDALIDAGLLPRLAELAMPVLARPLARLVSAAVRRRALPPLCNVVISSVVVPRGGLGVAGAPVCALYPLGFVVDGVGLNLTAARYRGTLFLGAVADHDAVADAAPLLRRVEDAFTELVKAAGARDRW